MINKLNRKNYLRISLGLSPKVVLKILVNQIGSFNPVAKAISEMVKFVVCSNSLAFSSLIFLIKIAVEVLDIAFSFLYNWESLNANSFANFSELKVLSSINK